MRAFLLVPVLVLAIYGAFSLGRGLWERLSEGRARLPFVSFLLILQNQEDKVEDLVRKLFLLREIASTPFEVVVVDNYSTDRTAAILSRLSKKYQGLIWVDRLSYPPDISPVELGVKICSGQVICLFNIEGKAEIEPVTTTALSLLRGGKFPSLGGRELFPEEERLH